MFCFSLKPEWVAIYPWAIGHMCMHVRKHQGEGAFYGPKIDTELQDALGRKHQWRPQTAERNLTRLQGICCANFLYFILPKKLLN